MPDATGKPDRRSRGSNARLYVSPNTIRRSLAEAPKARRRANAEASEVCMRWTKPAVIMTLGLLMVPAGSQLLEAQPRSKPVSRQEHDRVTDATFSSTMDEQGNARSTVAVGDFLLEKVLAPAGDATLRLSQGKDVVTIAINHNGYLVNRGKKSARLDSQSRQQEDLDSVRSVLLGSSAVRTFRRLGAALENRDESDDESPLFLSALIDGSIVQMLDGDSGATARIGKRVTRRRRAAIHQAMLRPDNLFTDCTLNYELSLVEAWDLFRQCQDTAWNNRWYVWFFAENFCELEFLLRSQQYIYQFLACFAYPF
jgi:hypothetical protein